MKHADIRTSAGAVYTALMNLCKSIEEGTGEVDIGASNALIAPFIGSFEAQFLELARSVHFAMPDETFIMRMLGEDKPEIAYMAIFLFDNFGTYWNTPALLRRGVKLVSRLKLSPMSQAHFHIELQSVGESSASGSSKRADYRAPRPPKLNEHFDGAKRTRGKRGGQGRKGQTVASISLDSFDEVSVANGEANADAAETKAEVAFEVAGDGDAKVEKKWSEIVEEESA